MFNKFLPQLVLGLWVFTVLPFAHLAKAITPLTKGEIQQLRNMVQLIPKNNSLTRPARKSDTINPGDALSTGRASLADLRFNDGSVARVGEQAVFRFLPQTRDFTLTNGTVLLLIPPGRGQTRIRTPNAAAAIRGSALFVRYNKESDTTIIGALTNSGIEVANKEASQNVVLQAGQLMVVVQGEFQGLYDFDLKNFYDNSDLVRGFDLNRQNSTSIPDPELASIQAETIAALAAQKPITGQGLIDNPSFLNKNFNPRNSSENNGVGRDQKRNNRPSRDNSARDPIRNNLRVPINTFIQTGEVIRENRQRNNPGNSDGVPGGGNTNNPGNSDGVPGGGNTNNPGNSDGVPGGG
ncbi:FecR domain-containing protein, partial [Anabaena cylindrica FACHB-243]